jgi:septal ring factor EnvC (AmiA/AmiB activator)
VLKRLVNIAFLLIPLVLNGQTKRELEKKQAQIEKDIEYTNQLLDITKKSKTSSMNHLVTLNKKITYRHDLINSISTEINVVDKEITSVSTNIDSLNNSMARLKRQYSAMLFSAYKNKSAYTKIMFVFSADDINQAFKRMLYLKQLSDYRIHQRDLLIAMEDSLSGKKQTLQVVKTDKNRLLTTHEKQIKELDSEKKEQVSLLNTLASKEKKLRNEIKEKQKAQQQLAAKIESIIRKEIEAARKADKKKGGSTTTANASTSKKLENSNNASILLNTPEAAKLSSAFENNKGSLPWPVERGFISSQFGRRTHPVWKDVVINNNGVDINSTKGSKARSIFDGKVIQVIVVLDHYAVLVQHGEYFTLYSNLEQVFVKRDDKVITKQPIGIIQTNEDDQKTELHLEIWRGGNKMDPEVWIASK